MQPPLGETLRSVPCGVSLRTNVHASWVCSTISLSHNYLTGSIPTVLVNAFVTRPFGYFNCYLDFNCLDEPMPPAFIAACSELNPEDCALEPQNVAGCK